jgi:23S rRNA pseudouridine2605 synthase
MMSTTTSLQPHPSINHHQASTTNQRATMMAITAELAASCMRPRALTRSLYSRPLNRWIFQEQRPFSQLQVASFSTKQPDNDLVRLSKLISQHSSNMSISRRETERMIRAGEVTVAGEQITAPHFLLSLKDSKSAIKIGGKLVGIKENASETTRTKVWLVHKLPGEVVTENDPQGRPSLLDRLRRGGVGNKADHLNAIGRLDMSTEGLILVTNDGQYKRELELPANLVHRVYRVRVHGKLTPYKLKALRAGMKIEEIRYRGMKVELEANRRQSSTNNWIRLTCVEGKNRQIRKVLNHLGLNVTRLIRISYGDYDLNTIPPGMALEVPVKVLSAQKKQGKLKPRKEAPPKKSKNDDEESARPVTWIKAF